MAHTKHIVKTMITLLQFLGPTVLGLAAITFLAKSLIENRLSVVTNTLTGQVTRFFYDGDALRERVKKIEGVTTTTVL